MPPTHARETHLTGEESLEVDEVGWGLEGAENIGHEGERGEGGLGQVDLRHTHAHTLCHCNQAEVK